MKIEVSVGEVIDKITILEIKEQRIQDDVKLKHIKHELKSLTETLNKSGIEVPGVLIKKLKDINLLLWDTEEKLRDKQKNQQFDAEFTKHAIADATYNDQRFLIKNEINNLCDSQVKEQKSYDGLYTAD